MAEQVAEKARSGRKQGGARASARQERLRAIVALAESEGWERVDADAWGRLREKFQEVSENTLRHDLRETGLAVAALVEGVRLDSLEHLARTLLALAEADASALTNEPRLRVSAARRLVLEARRKAEVVLRNPRVEPAKRAAMEEKFLWIRTWLENPDLFPAWAPLRLQKVRNPEGIERHPSG
jgi:hypothetical protein